MKYIGLLLAFSLYHLSAFTQYAGRVYHDQNGNSQYDSSEVGIANVLVSNGEQVVKTDAKGLYHLPQSLRDKFVFITTPSGYRCQQFYLPNKGQSQDYHFALTTSSFTDTFSFLHISDTETADSTLWVQMLKAYSHHQQPAFIIHTGDICYEDGMRFHADQVNSQSMGLPMYYSVGNHDLVAGDYGEQLYEELFGPVYYSFDVGNVHFVVTPMLRGDFQPQYTQEDVYQWLKNDLAQVPLDQPKIIFNHDLLRSEEGFVYRISEQEAIDLEKYNLKAWIYGHWHNHHFYRYHADSEVISICTSPPNKGGIDHSISAFRVFDMQPNGEFTTHLVQSYVNHQLAIAAPAPHTRLTPDGKIPILVNAYNSTAPTQSVTYSIAKAENQPLEQISNWAWKGTYPYDIKFTQNDSLHILVEGTFSDGQTRKIDRHFRISNFKSDTYTNAKTDWPNFLVNAQRNPDATNTVEPPLRLNWISNIGANIYHCSPIVAEGKVFIASIDDGDARNCYVFAYDMATGKLIWKYRTRNSVKHSIAYGDGLVLAADQIGYLYALDAKTGELTWEKDLKMDVLPTYVSGVLIHQDIVYAGDGYKFSALRVKDGRLLWQNDKWPQRMGGPAMPSIGDGVILASSNWQHLYAFEEKTGKPLWNNSEQGLRFRNASPVFYEGHFYTTSKNALFKINPQTGVVLLMSETTYNLNAASSPVITEDLFIVGTVDAGIRAFDRNTFEEVWHFETQPALTVSAPYSGPNVKTVAASPVVSGNNVYVGGLDGNFYCLQAHNGKLKWSLELGAPIFSTVAIVDSLIFISDFGGNLYNFSQER